MLAKQIQIFDETEYKMGSQIISDGRNRLSC